MRRTFARLATAVLLAATGFAAGAQVPAAAQGVVPWTVATAANEFGADRANYSYTAEPGEQVRDGLVIANRGTAPLDLAVYSADAFTTAAGQLDLVTRDTRSHGVGAWVHPAADHVTLPPGQSADVPFTLTIPPDATPGDHLGGLVTSVRQGDVERRLGLRVHLRVGGALTPRLSVEDARVDYSGTPNPFGTGEATLSYTIRNTGNAIAAARQTASVTGPFGTFATPSAPIPDSPQLLPGETWHVVTSVHDVVPAVRLSAAVSVTPLLTDASGSTAPLPAVPSVASGWAVPWALVVLLAVACAPAAVLLARRHRGKTEVDSRVDGEVAEEISATAEN
ncbi:WxL protein peptidoglycan domain-containing protein [Amycolatopsis sp. NPDC051903]|uniref:WxL protein peptidoglycan domain-containing protein n=1 Tax=Amycolatopsis sp. NPDC051903 TaxID=3363936 RepID=UPI00378F88D0